MAKKVKQLDIEDEIAKRRFGRLDAQGQEIPDPQPIAVASQLPLLTKRTREMVITGRVLSSDFDVLEDENDFDDEIMGDETFGLSPHELPFMETATELAEAKRSAARKPAAKKPPREPEEPVEGSANEAAGEVAPKKRTTPDALADEGRN